MSKNMTIIDPSTDSVAATIQLIGWPETAISDGIGQNLFSAVGFAFLLQAATSRQVQKFRFNPSKSLQCHKKILQVGVI